MNPKVKVLFYFFNSSAIKTRKSLIPSSLFLIPPPPPPYLSLLVLPKVALVFSRVVHLLSRLLSECLNLGTWEVFHFDTKFYFVFFFFRTEEFTVFILHLKMDV